MLFRSGLCKRWRPDSSRERVKASQIKSTVTSGERTLSSSEAFVHPIRRSYLMTSTSGRNPDCLPRSFGFPKPVDSAQMRRGCLLSCAYIYFNSPQTSDGRMKNTLLGPSLYLSSVNCTAVSFNSMPMTTKGLVSFNHHRYYAYQALPSIQFPTTTS